ncbi:MAG: M24 family metallopeptidase, partial [Nanoarchaeota archaeon]
SKNDIDCIFFSNIFNKDKRIYSLVNLNVDYSFLIIPKKGNLNCFVSKMEYSFAKKNITNSKLLCFNQNLFLEIFNLLKNKKLTKIMIDFKKISLFELNKLKKYFKKTKFLDFPNEVNLILSIKDNDEITKIKKACKITDLILNDFINNIKNFKTEKCAKAFLLKKIYDNNCKPSFDIIVASSINSSFPHYSKLNSKIKNGFLLIDFGVDYLGYKSDISRTFYIGKPNKFELEMYNLVLNTQINSIKMIKDNIKSSDIDNFTRKSLGKYSKNFIHALGHGVGVNIHECPSINSSSKDILYENMTIAIEPGIYFENKFGIRIEDTILVKKNKCIVLTKTKKELIIIDK